MLWHKDIVQGCLLNQWPLTPKDAARVVKKGSGAFPCLLCDCSHMTPQGAGRLSACMWLWSWVYHCLAEIEKSCIIAECHARQIKRNYPVAVVMSSLCHLLGKWQGTQNGNARPGVRTAKKAWMAALWQQSLHGSLCKTKWWGSTLPSEWVDQLQTDQSSTNKNTKQCLGTTHYYT